MVRCRFPGRAGDIYGKLLGRTQERVVHLSHLWKVLRALGFGALGDEMAFGRAMQISFEDLLRDGHVLIFSHLACGFGRPWYSKNLTPISADLRDAVSPGLNFPALLLCRAFCRAKEHQSEIAFNKCQ